MDGLEQREPVKMFLSQLGSKGSQLSGGQWSWIGLERRSSSAAGTVDERSQFFHRRAIRRQCNDLLEQFLMQHRHPRFGMFQSHSIAFPYWITALAASPFSP